jgi:Family of unknown function (DUF6526)
MSEKMPQTYANHTRFDPPFHFFVIPVVAITFFVTIWMAVHESFSFPAVWVIVAALAGLVAAFKIRLYALRVQDRVIRLEERLRLATALPEPLRARIGELNESQLIALRFASDAELPALVEKTLAGKLPAAEIKKAITNWRPDYFRV